MRDESEMLAEMNERLARIEAALFGDPRTGQRPMMERISDVVLTMERGGWAVKWSVRIIMTAGGVLAFMSALSSFVAGKGGG